ncbi:hypothetical protein NQ318_009053 [Aromia moschata]|uniref:EF-hand domain-containing protein n=1 Tax=Aromia moschata TaxID=1265417 RepID=A0AAV8YWP4_9CUCU|nr:hypothetical protein NQ318_009053 [Aromia moschata]
MQNNRSAKSEDIIDTEKSSPDREVSPKFVYGSKKYGRRSRPRNDEITPIFNEQNDTGLNKSPNNASVQRSNSQTEVSSKKRKTNYKLKRCVSLPGHNDLALNNGTDGTFITSHTLSSEPELVCTEEMLREAWRKLGVGEDGHLNRTELILVCDAIGLHKLADGVIRQLSDKLTVNYDHKISFQELLEALQQDETWFEVLNPSPPNHQPTDNLFPDSRTFQFITLGPDGNGIISTDVLVEMWESVGIHSPKDLIHELGFNGRRISIVELANVLDKQIKGMNEATRSEYQSPHLTLLQANVTLYQSEIKCLKSVLEQMHAEREKLKCDVVEANNRATLLAQEVDDNHSRMEQNTLNQVKLLEQRHSDILKEVTAQYSKDKEQLSSINQTLESRISSLEQETVKLKNDLLVAQKYSLNVEKDNQILSGRITDLEKDKCSLTEQIGALENEKQNSSEIERQENELLLSKLTALQLENSQLKDKNDEMVSEIECLSSQVASMRTKASSTPTPSYNTLDQSMEENISIICEGVGVGAKRRSDYSPSKDVNLFSMTDGSPRLGKVRKFQKVKGENLEIPFTSSESGFDTEVDCYDSSLSVSASENEEITRLQAKVAFLEQILIQNSIPIPTNESKDSETGLKSSSAQLATRVKTLEQVIFHIKAEMGKMIEKDCVNCDTLRNVNEKLEQTLLGEGDQSNSFRLEIKEKLLSDVGLQTDFIDSFAVKVRKLEDENRELCAKCSELENCVELLRNEYEKCEDYWQNKVDEERQMFEAEQRVNSDKLTELIIKMREYEEQYASQDVIDTRLPTIEETYNLEKQFTDLEQEFEEYKAQSENELFKKDEEIAILKEKLTEFAVRQQQVNEVAIQVAVDSEEHRILEKMRNFSSYVIENTSRYSDEMMPPCSQAPVPSPTPNNLDYVNQSLVWEQQTNQTAKSEMSSEASTNSNAAPLNWNFTNNTKAQTNVASTSSSSTCLEKNSTPCRPKRTRKHDKNMYKKNNQEKEAKKAENVNVAPPQPEWKGFQNLKGSAEQTVVLPLSSFHNLNGRKNYLEQRVRHLQMCIKQQHYCNEQTLQHYWQQFRGERADLHSKLKYLQEKLDQQVRISNEQLDKLERTDLLVKDLYIENAYLIASVQRLEQQCHMLAQCNSSSSSV